MSNKESSLVPQSHWRESPPPLFFSTSRVDCDADQPARGLRHEQAEGKDNEVEEEEGGGDDAYQLGGRAEGHESGSGRGGGPRQPVAVPQKEVHDQCDHVGGNEEDNVEVEEAGGGDSLPERVKAEHEGVDDDGVVGGGEEGEDVAPQSGRGGDDSVPEVRAAHGRHARECDHRKVELAGGESAHASSFAGGFLFGREGGGGC
jgi:hypothetical protein